MVALLAARPVRPPALGAAGVATTPSDGVVAGADTIAEALPLPTPSAGAEACPSRESEDLLRESE
ncbi:hypothetical protein [Streptomyces sp. NPDC019507]|uniref:hypothetical protein n=1 Tax=Streptomyces sp. NPDC019507 TaxID=3154689 RepID=UPI0033E49E68